MNKIFKIQHLVCDKTLYPRDNVNWFISHKYAKAMEAGAIFPSITVARINDTDVVLDGWHRIEACRRAKKSIIEGELVKLSKNNWFAEAKAISIERNTAHGQALSPYEQARAIRELQDLKFSKEQISKIIHIPALKLDSFVAKRLAKSIAGEDVVLKRPMHYLAGTVVDIDIIGKVQGQMDYKTQVVLIWRVIKLMQSGLLDTDNEGLMHTLKKLQEELDKII